MDNNLPVGVKLVKKSIGGIKWGGLIVGLRVMGDLRGKISWILLFYLFNFKLIISQDQVIQIQTT